MDDPIDVEMAKEDRGPTTFTLYQVREAFELKYHIYMRNMFTLRNTSYNLRCYYILTLPVPKTTTYCLRSFSYHVVKQWNSLPDNVRTLNLYDLKKVLASYSLNLM